MNTIASTISLKEPPSLKRVKSKNKKLVRILNHKMFKGYREIKESKDFNFKKPKYIDSIFWENRILDPFDDNYNLEYKRKNLSSIYNKDFTDMIQINNYSKKKQNDLKNSKYQRKSDNHKTRNNFRKKQNTNLYLKKSPYNDKYFYFSSNSLLIKNDLDKNEQQKNILFKTIFADKNEKGLYNDIPIFAIEKIYKINYNKKKKYIYLPSKEERMRDLQFLYKVSHKLPIKKIDFRNKYNIKSVTQRKKINKNMEKSPTLTCLPHKIQSAKPYKNRPTLKRNNSDIFMTNIISENENKKNKNNINNKNIENKDIDFKSFHKIIVKRAQSSSAYKSRNMKLIKNFSAGILNVNKNFRINKNSSKEIKSEFNFFPSIDRFVNDQIFLNYINYKKSKFQKLKQLIEY